MFDEDYQVFFRLHPFNIWTLDMYIRHRHTCAIKFIMCNELLFGCADITSLDVRSVVNASVVLSNCRFVYLQLNVPRTLPRRHTMMTSKLLNQIDSRSVTPVVVSALSSGPAPDTLMLALLWNIAPALI